MSILLLMGTFLHAVEIVPLPGVRAELAVPAGWTIRPGTGLLLHGPARDPATAARLIIMPSANGVEAAATAMREGWLRLTDGCEIGDDSEVPLGGRVWRRIGARFATGPLVFAQIAWIGTVDGRTVIAVLSAPEEGLAASAPVAGAALATISLRR